jgi:hypothetical protein
MHGPINSNYCVAYPTVIHVGDAFIFNENVSTFYALEEIDRIFGDKERITYTDSK